MNAVAGDSPVAFGVTRRVWTVSALVFLAGFALSSGLAARLGDLGIEVFKQIARAQYELHLATRNVTADGRAEFAVLLTGGMAADELGRFVQSRPGWSARASAVPGWSVVSVPAGTEQVLPALRGEPFARAVLRNRGLWICH